jgi:hypothetical protein
MRDFLKSSARRLAAGWYWPLVILALPNCGLDTTGTCCATHLNTGPLPHSDVIFCDIEVFNGRHCPTADELTNGVRLAAAAIALESGQKNNIGLDYSPTGLAACSGGPQAVTFQGPFPNGTPVCLNCGAVIPAPHADSTAVCVAQCRDLIDQGEGPKPADTLAFCTANAHVSTNHPAGCISGACTSGGTLRDDFVDPRLAPEFVTWQDIFGASPAGGTLTRTAANSGMWDAGATSSQKIGSGDAYVEFTATETNKARVGGLSNGAPPDTEPSFTDIDFGIALGVGGSVHIFEHGTPKGAFGTYVSGDKFRVTVKDNFDGNAVVSYSKISTPCNPGTLCDEAVFYTSLTAGHYPFRVDASLFDQNATLTDVHLVRIH